MNPTNHKASKKRKHLSHHVFEGMLYYMPAETSLGTVGDIHKIIYEMQQKQKYDLLGVFDFFTEGISPVSDEVMHVIRGLEGKIYSLPFVFGEGNKFKISSCFKEGTELNILPLFNKKELKQLKEMANDYVNVASKYIE